MIKKYIPLLSPVNHCFFTVRIVLNSRLVGLVLERFISQRSVKGQPFSPSRNLNEESKVGGVQLMHTYCFKRLSEKRTFSNKSMCPTDYTHLKRVKLPVYLLSQPVSHS